jgi:hypothetical protein
LIPALRWPAHSCDLSTRAHDAMALRFESSIIEPAAPPPIGQSLM